MKTQFFLGAMVLSCAALVLSGCGRESSSQDAIPATPVDGGTCVIGVFGDFDSLNELVSTDATTTTVMENMLYMALFRWRKDLTIEGRLAKTWEYSPDSLEITVHLRDDIRWHDGVPTTASDVKYTFDVMKNPKLGYPDIAGLKEVESIEVLDETTVRFRFTRPSLNQLTYLRRLILPKHRLESTPIDQMKLAPQGREPVGNGPFRFVRWTRDQEIVFEANPDFPDGRPHLDRVVFRVIPDQTAIETAFKSGEIDVVERLRLSEVAPLRQDPRFNVFTYPQRGYQFISWNMRDPLFRESATRMAMTLAIDRQRIVDALAFGEGKVAAHPIMSLSPFYARDIEPYPYDPERAKALLAQSGWKDTNGDGILDRDGKKFEFTLVTNIGNQMREDALVMIQDDLRKVGVSVKPQVLEWTVFMGRVKEKDFQACHMGWQTDFIVNPFDLFHSKAIEGIYNLSSYSNPRVDELIDRGLAAHTAAEAKPIWHEMQVILHEEQPYSMLYEMAFSVGASKKVRGIEIDVRSWLLNIEDWWIAKPSV